jgi:hypothetical protein
MGGDALVWAARQSPPCFFQRRRLVTPITDPEPVSCETRSIVQKIMSRKLIAAVVLLVVSATGTFAQLPASRDASPSMPIDLSNASQSNSAHPCCHSSSAAPFEIALPPNIPCGSEHSCCLRPAPTNSANLPSISGQQRPETGFVDRINQRPTQPGSQVSIRISCAAAFLPYAVLSTVLRI